jgi:pSer/pThr/pTyr-binding forkhead associated (FHA) protein
MVPLDATALAQGCDFSSAVEMARSRIASQGVLWGIDVRAARAGSPQVRPLPDGSGTGSADAVEGSYSTTRLEETATPLTGLRLEVAADPRRHWNLAGHAVRIGRSPVNQVRLADPTVAREHAVVFFKEGQVFVKDLGSASGTFAGGRLLAPLEPVAIGPPCLVRVGGIELRLRRREKKTGNVSARGSIL